MQGYLLELEKEALEAIDDAGGKAELESLRTKYLGRKNGLITKVIKDLPTLSPEEKRVLGPLINQVKNSIEEALGTVKSIPTPEIPQDLTAPGKKLPVGKLHPMSIAIEEITSIFQELGFSIYGSGPEVDWFWYAFEALNMPPTHPAADDFETYFLDTEPDPKFGRMLLRPHATSSQVRLMQTKEPPYRAILIGKAYRPNVSARHTPMFHNLEAVVVEKGSSISNLKAAVNYFVHRYFGANVKTRLRPHHFNFTEPSFEVDITCTVCKGKGCQFCKYSGWSELAGAGMIHPNVLKAGGLDPKIWSGFAWGWGIERCLAIKYQIPDIRVLYDNDLRTLGSIS